MILPAPVSMRCRTAGQGRRGAIPATKLRRTLPKCGESSGAEVNEAARRRRLIGLVLENGGPDQQSFISRQVRGIPAESGHDQRPLIEQPHLNDVARAAGIEVKIRADEIAAVVD